MQKKDVFKGVDWSTSISRPGCQDHLKHPSRRGDKLVPHQAPMHLVGQLKDKKPNGY